MSLTRTYEVKMRTRSRATLRNSTDVSEEVHDAFVEFLDLYPLKEMDAVIVTKKKDRVTDAEKVERLAKRYWWAIVILGITTGVFCKLYVIYHCRHHHTRKNTDS